jgi:glucose-6-phosphate 1-dehydrogenase
MTSPHSDALVFFGATGDLAYKKIFPALQAISPWDDVAVSRRRTHAANRRNGGQQVSARR